MIVQSPSGTGKTDTFGLITLNEIDPTLKEVQIVVFCYTQELARQTYAVFKDLTQCFDPEIEIKLSVPLTEEEQRNMKKG